MLDLFRKMGVKLGAEEELFFMGVCVSVSSGGGKEEGGAAVSALSR